MNDVFKQFYNAFYTNTNGFMPSMPLSQNVYPGDFFQIKNNEMLVLGNIFKKGVIDVDKAEFGYGIPLNPSNWNFSHGVSKPYSGRSSGHNDMDGDFSFSKQILAFQERGNFSFKGVNPESVKFLNWRSFQDELIIKLTQVLFSFRELYIVTEVASVDDWTLAIAGSDKSELEIAMKSENYGLVNIFGHADATTIQAKDIEYYNREEHRKPVFLKAIKLVLKNEKVDYFISELISGREFKNKWVKEFFDYEFHEDASFYAPSSNIAQTSILDLLQANELNPNTALQYFKWEEANLDDIQLLFN